MNLNNFSLLDVIFLAVRSKDERSHEATRGHGRSQEVMGGHRRFKKAKNKLRIQETVILQLCLITSKSLTSKSLTSKSLTTLSHYK